MVHPAPENQADFDLSGVRFETERPSRLEQVLRTPGKNTPKQGFPDRIKAEREAELDTDIDPDFSRHILQLGHIELVIEPGRVRDWEEFRKNAPPYSIALDGYVSGLQEPDLDSPNGPKVNFNHHEGVVRGATSATCAQVYEAIKDSLFDTFEPGNDRKARVYVNDCDHDVCLAVWLLSKYDEFTGTMAPPSIERLVEHEDRLDRFAGAYPYSRTDPMLPKLAWIFQPYTNARGLLQGMKAEQMANIIETIHGRLSKYFEGEGQTLEPRGGFQRLGEAFEDIPEPPQGWAYITNEEPFARTYLRAAGTSSFISVFSATEDLCRCSIGKFGPYVRVNLAARIEVLNEAERLKGAIEVTACNQWGGGNTIIGSPRKTGSGLSLTEITTINNRLAEIEQGGNGGLTSERLRYFLSDELPDLVSKVPDGEA